jgi:hypothetical protein
MGKLYLQVHGIQEEGAGIFLFFTEPIPVLRSMNLAIQCAQTICTAPAGTANGEGSW